MFLTQLCCCSKDRKSDTDSNLNDIEGNFTNLRKILIEFVYEESKIGIRDVSFLDLQEKLLLQTSNKRTIPKADIQPIFMKVGSYQYL